MRVLVLSTSTNNTENFRGSLECLGQHEISTLFYDRRWHEQAMQAIQQNPSFREQLESGQAHLPRERCAMDSDLLHEASLGKPDAIVYISARWGDFLPLNETLEELNGIAPLIHFCSDGADPPWWSELAEFDRRQCFALTVNIDGTHVWPGGKDWPEQNVPFPKLTGKCLTLLTPVDVRWYPPAQVGHTERPYAIGYAGNNGGHFRSAIVQRMSGVPGFIFKQRDMNAGSYPGYADFLRHCRVSISVPFTGSGAARQVKGRVLETGFAGATLLEWKNDATRGWFTPRHEYEEFSSVEECAELGAWLAGHPQRAEEMARALNNRVVTEHAPGVFWQKVFEGVGK